MLAHLLCSLLQFALHVCGSQNDTGVQYLGDLRAIEDECRRVRDFNGSCTCVIPYPGRPNRCQVPVIACPCPPECTFSSHCICQLEGGHVNFQYCPNAPSKRKMEEACRKEMPLVGPCECVEPFPGGHEYYCNTPLIECACLYGCSAHQSSCVCNATDGDHPVFEDCPTVWNVSVLEAACRGEMPFNGTCQCVNAAALPANSGVCETPMVSCTDGCPQGLCNTPSCICDASNLTQPVFQCASGSLRTDALSILLLFAFTAVSIIKI